MQATHMYIRLEGMKFYAYHGVLPQENLVGANYYIDLKLKTDFSRAAETDELEGTVNYADIHAVVKEEMQITSQLLEHVCQRIARRIFHDFPSIETIDISLFKENPLWVPAHNVLEWKHITYDKRGFMPLLLFSSPPTPAPLLAASFP